MSSCLDVLNTGLGLFFFNLTKYPVRYKMNEKVPACCEPHCRWCKVGVANDSLQEYIKSSEFGLGSDHWPLNAVKSLTFAFCVYVCLVYVLVHVSVLTVTDFIKVLSIDN